MNEPVVYQSAPAPVAGRPLAPVQLPSGQWVYAPAPQPPPQVVVQVPAGSAGLSREMRELIVVVVLILAVVVVCTAAVCAVVVLVGGTLMGIVGAVAANAVPLTVGVVAALLAAGWAAGKIRGASGETRPARRGRRG